jgi:hypothetical protein
MKQLLIALSFVVACGGKQSSPSTVDNTAPAAKPATGKAGDVCAVGDQHVGEKIAVDCGPGFNCCYPCGIDGCDSVCMAGDCPTGIP